MNATDFGILHLLEALNEKLEGLKELNGMKYLNQIEQDFYVDLASKFRRTSQELREFVPNVYNASQPINKLPVEILTTTFNMIQDSPVRAFPPSRDGLEAYGLNRWLMVTHVCQHWRRASLSTASLWTNIIMGPDLHDYEGLQAWFMHHCGPSAPVHWHLHVAQHDLKSRDAVNEIHYFSATGRSFSTSFLSLFQANLHRMRSIVIRSSAKPFESVIHLGSEFLQILCTGQLPNLETLSLCLPSGTYDENDEDDEDDEGDEDDDDDEDDEDVNFYPLPPIANGHLPQIRRLSLGGTSTLTGNTSSRLTHLSLYDQDHRNRPTINQFLDFLEANPTLEVLWIENAGPIVKSHQLVTTGRQISFPRLNHIRIGWGGEHPTPETVGLGDGTECFIWLLGIVSIPKDTMITLWSPDLFPDWEPGELPLTSGEEAMKHILSPYLSRITSVFTMVESGKGDRQARCFCAMVINDTYMQLNVGVGKKSCLYLLDPLAGVRKLSLSFQSSGKFHGSYYSLKYDEVMLQLFERFSGLLQIQINSSPNYSTEISMALKPQFFSLQKQLVFPCPALEELIFGPLVSSEENGSEIFRVGIGDGKKSYLQKGDPMHQQPQVGRPFRCIFTTEKHGIGPCFAGPHSQYTMCSGFTL